MPIAGWNYDLLDRLVCVLRSGLIVFFYAIWRWRSGARWQGGRQSVGRRRHHAGMDAVIAAAVPSVREAADDQVRTLKEPRRQSVSGLDRNIDSTLDLVPARDGRFPRPAVDEGDAGIPGARRLDVPAMDAGGTRKRLDARIVREATIVDVQDRKDLSRLSATDQRIRATDSPRARWPPAGRRQASRSGRWR